MLTNSNQPSQAVNPIDSVLNKISDGSEKLSVEDIKSYLRAVMRCLNSSGVEFHYDFDFADFEEDGLPDVTDLLGDLNNNQQIDLSWVLFSEPVNCYLHLYLQRGKNASVALEFSPIMLEDAVYELIPDKHSTEQALEGLEEQISRIKAFHAIGIEKGYSLSDTSVMADKKVGYVASASQPATSSVIGETIALYKAFCERITAMESSGIIAEQEMGLSELSFKRVESSEG